MKKLTVTDEDLSKLGQKIAENKAIGLDYETTSAHPMSSAPLHHDKLKVAGIGFGFPDGDSTYVPLAHADSELASYDASMKLLGKVLADPELEVWAHNIKFEIGVSRVVGIQPEVKWRDSMLAQWLLGKGLGGKRGYKLKAAVEEYLKHKMLTWEEVVPDKKRIHEVSAKLAGKYCADDALQTLRLGELWTPELAEMKILDVFERIECPFAEVLGHMSEVGFAVNRELLTDLSTTWCEEMAELSESFEGLAGVRISSNPAVSKRMFDELKWWKPIEDRGKSGNYSIRSGVRSELAKMLKPGSPGWVALELKNRYQAIAKLESTYTHSLVSFAEMFGDNRVRAGFHQAGTATGRLSSSGPNLQNIPRKGDGARIRDAFIAEDGWKLCLADYSQADLVMMAHLSRDPALLRAYVEGLDLHQQTADACGCDRDTGKTMNLGIIYEMGPVTMANNLGIPHERGKMLHARWHQTYPLVRAYHERQHAYARKYGYVRTITGRIRYLPDIHSKNHVKRAISQREASNTSDQGSVADTIKIAMRNLYREWKERGILFDVFTGKGKAKILSQVHDEVICEFTDDFAEEGALDLKRHMETAVELRAPMTAGPGIGDTWTEAKKDSKRREDAEKLAKESEVFKV